MSEENFNSMDSVMSGDSTGGYFDSVQVVTDDGDPIEMSNGNQPEIQQQTAVQPTIQQPGIQQQQPVQQTTEPPKMNPALAGIFNESGEVDLAKATKFFGDIRGYSYQRQPYQAPAAAQQPIQQQVAPVQAPEPPKTWRDEYKTYEQTLKANLLAPLQELWDDNLAAGAKPDDPVMQNLNRRYALKNEELTAHLEAKQAELQDKYLADRVKAETQRFTDMELAAKSEANLAELYQQVGGRNEYERLVFGSADANGNWVPGPGTEFVNYAYALQNPDKPNGTAEEYQKWWRDYTANPDNARFALKTAAAFNLLNNFDSILAKARQDIEQQYTQRKQGAFRAPGGGGQAVAPVSDAPLYDPAVARFAGM